VNTPSRTPGICRIDQPEKYNHGFFVRLQRNGKIHSAFFSDKMHGGRAPALVAAQAHLRKLAAKLGTPVRMSRRKWAELRRRKGSSSIVGVQKLVDRRSTRPRTYWKATWSPEPYVVRRKWFSAKKFGARKAKKLAIRTRRAGVRSMQPAAS
jgi:AP2 domain